MVLEDLVIGWVLSRFFGKGGETRSPAVTFQPPAGTPSTSAPQPAQVPQFPAQVPVANTPTTAPPASKPPTTAPPQGQPAPAGFKRAIEVWIVQPRLAQQGSAAISGMGPQVGAMALAALEAQFPVGWQAAKSATAAEAAQAKALLATWKDGGVVFGGPATLTGRRAFKMTKHPGAAAPQATTAPPLPSTASFPTGVTVPPAGPSTAPPGSAPPFVPPTAPVVTTTPGGGKVTTLPEILITADAPNGAAAPAAQPVNQITLVRKGEGLANVAKRLGQPATGTSATVIQRANVPGPDGLYTAQALDKGGLKKKNRAGGLQPGDRLFVPPQWGPVDPARL